MRILVERSGGFAGIKKQATVDSAALSAEESAEFDRLAQAAGVFDLPASPRSSPRGADAFQYNLTIETPERRHSAEVRDPEPAVKRLIDWVWSHQK